MQFGEKTLEQWLQTLKDAKKRIDVDGYVFDAKATVNPDVGSTEESTGLMPNGASPQVPRTILSISSDVGSTKSEVIDTKSDLVEAEVGLTVLTSAIMTPPSSSTVDAMNVPKLPGSSDVVVEEPAVAPLQKPSTNIVNGAPVIPNGISSVKPTPVAPRRSWAGIVASNVPSQPVIPTRYMSPPKAPPSPITPQAITPPLPLPSRCIRGMVNAGNTCFINVILQALMGCDDFRRFFLAARNNADPLVGNLSALARDMSLAPDAKPQIVRDSKSLPNVAEPLLPEWASEIFPATLPKPPTGGRAVQEDAQEFLGFLLNKLHDILVSSGTKPVEDESGEWQEMTRKGRTVTVRPVNSADTSAIADIFGFVLRAEIKRPRATATMTRETNMFIQLDISSGMIRNVDDALLDYFRAERIEGETNGESQDIRKSCYMETLPKVLILHLKRFAHTRETNRQNKVGRVIGLNEELTIPSQALYSSVAAGSRKYRLTAVVVHAGKDMRGGHYYGDVRVRNGERDIWVSCDDAKVTQVGIQKVLRRQAYLLFYSRVMVPNGIPVRR